MRSAVNLAAKREGMFPALCVSADPFLCVASGVCPLWDVPVLELEQVGTGMECL